MSAPCSDLRIICLKMFVFMGAPVSLFAQSNTFPPSGNVGIGTTTPSNLLYVKQTSVSNPGYNSVVGIGYDDSQTFGGSFGMRVVSGNPRYGLKIASNLNLTSYSPVSSSNPAFQWQTGTISDESTDSGTVMTITGQGNVGIGLASPNGKLDVESSSGNQRAYFLATASGAAADLNIGNSVSGADRMLVGEDATNHYAYIDSGKPLILQEPGNGNVGIGTTTPDQTLSVNGTVHAKEVLVDNSGWPDWVFSEGQQLPSPSEVERTIREQKHLPGMPSSAEVAAHGVNVGAMQAKLLAQIEELTLHAIDQEKHQIDLEKRVDAQASEIEQLKKENAQLRAAF